MFCSLMPIQILIFRRNIYHPKSYYILCYYILRYQRLLITICVKSYYILLTIKFCATVTFCVSYYILWRNRTLFSKKSQEQQWLILSATRKCLLAGIADPAPITNFTRGWKEEVACHRGPWARSTENFAKIPKVTRTDFVGNDKIAISKNH